MALPGCPAVPVRCSASSILRLASRRTCMRFQCHHSFAAEPRLSTYGSLSLVRELRCSSVSPRHVHQSSPRRQPDLSRSVATPQSHPFNYYHNPRSSILKTSVKGSQARALHTQKTHTPPEYPFPIRQGWRPGQEPGIDPSKLDGGRPESAALHTECDITVVDFSEHDIVVNDFVNSTLPQFLGQPREEWVKCRWINVNGLSWDVIREIGKYKNFHRLAIEDLMNTRNRTKSDWYTDHIFMVLPLLKLTEIDHKEPAIRGRAGDQTTAKNALPNSLHRLRAEANPERAAFMEENSLLTSRNLGVSSEQVSIFLTSDNTLISFFESSGNDVETPLITRLSSRDTILRHSCDASMLCQALLDAIIDLSFPLVHAYQDAIGDLEVEVLTSPGVHHTRSLYVITREIAAMRSAISPTIGLINTLRDHGPSSVSPVVPHHPQSNPFRYGPQPYCPTDGARGMSSVAISPLAITYLTDVLDHCFLITDALDQMRHTSDGLIGLIFNTIGTRQNESMRQLTFVSIIFLPMSFLTGYFGMNFETFPSIQHSEWFFWGVAIPVATMTVLLLMRRTIMNQIRAKAQMLSILRSRRTRIRGAHSEPGLDKRD